MFEFSCTAVSYALTVLEKRIKFNNGYFRTDDYQVGLYLIRNQKELGIICISRPPEKKIEEYRKENVTNTRKSNGRKVGKSVPKRSEKSKKLSKGDGGTVGTEKTGSTGLSDNESHQENEVGMVGDNESR